MTDRFHPITHPIRSPVPGGKADDNPDVAFVQRADVNPDAGGIHGAFQHVAIFKNILVAADGDKSARLRVFDVRDWSEKQVIRVGAVSEATTGDSSGGGGPAPAAVTSLAFDGTTIACGTAEGHAHTWRLAELEGKRGYVRLLQPLRVDSQPVTRLSLATEANLLTAYSPTKRTLVVWSLESGKLHAAYSVDGVAKGTPLRFTANVESVTACVHAFTDEDDPHGERGVLAALLDVKTGEGGAVVGVREVTAGEGEPRCLTFDGELLCVGTSGGAVIAWNVGRGVRAVERVPRRGGRVRRERAGGQGQDRVRRRRPEDYPLGRQGQRAGANGGWLTGHRDTRAVPAVGARGHRGRHGRGGGVVRRRRGRGRSSNRVVPRR